MRGIDEHFRIGHCIFSLARRGGGSHLEPVVAERTARFARWRVLLVDCADGTGGRAAFCAIPVPAARERPAGTRGSAVRTEIPLALIWMVQAVVMACRLWPSCVSRIGGRQTGEKNSDAVERRDRSILSRPAIRAFTRLTNRGDRHKVHICLDKEPPGARKSKLRNLLSDVILPVRLPRAGAIRADPITCESRGLPRSRPIGLRKRPLNLRHLGVCLRRHRIHFKLYEVDPSLASAIKPAGERRREARMAVLYNEGKQIFNGTGEIWR